LIYTKFTYYLNENKEFAVVLIKKCLDAMNARNAARKAKENSYDAAKEMDQMLKYAKVVTIRDIQKAEHKKE